jgi:hypothetical protein
LNLTIEGGKPNIRYSHGTDPKFELTSDTTVSDNDWHLLGFSVDYSSESEQTTVAITVDGGNEKSLTTDPGIIFYQDGQNFVSYVGAKIGDTFLDVDLSLFYEGHIWSFCLDQMYTSNYSSYYTTTPGCSVGPYCTTCPEDVGVATCLIDCDWDQYLNEEGECTDCTLDDCGACMRADNCN